MNQTPKVPDVSESSSCTGFLRLTLIAEGPWAIGAMSITTKRSWKTQNSRNDTTLAMEHDKRLDHYGSGPGKQHHNLWCQVQSPKKYFQGDKKVVNCFRTRIFCRRVQKVCKGHLNHRTLLFVVPLRASSFWYHIGSIRRIYLPHLKHPCDQWLSSSREGHCVHLYADASTTTKTKANNNLIGSLLFVDARSAHYIHWNSYHYPILCLQCRLSSHPLCQFMACENFALQSRYSITMFLSIRYTNNHLS